MLRGNFEKGITVLAISREQWNPAAIPTILTGGQRQPATATNRRSMLANGAVFASGPSTRPGPRIIAGEATHEGIAFCADGVCRAAQVSCHLAGTAELSRPRSHDAELRGRAGRVCTRRGDGVRLDQLLGTPLLGQQAYAKPGGHGGGCVATLQEGTDRPLRATAAASQSRPG